MSTTTHHPRWPPAQLLFGLAIAAVVTALWPRAALAAGCGITDPMACAQGMEYSLWYGVAGALWTVDRAVLAMAYQLDQFRAWLVQVAFSSAYDALVAFVQPTYVPVASFALVVALVLMMLAPITGRIGFTNLRHVLIWIVVAPALMTLSGPMIQQLETIRVDVATQLFGDASGIAPGAIFGPAASDMPKPRKIYPSGACNGTLARPLGAGNGLHMDDLAAALLYADAGDIWCPSRGGPSQDIPDRFYEAAPGGPGYAFDGDVGQLASPVERTAAIQGIQRGVTRLAIGILPAVLAVVGVFIQLLFSLSLLVLWLSLPLGLIFVFFQQTSVLVSGIFRRAVSVLQVSWSSSFVLGLLSSALVTAANTGNASAYAGFSFGTLLICLYLVLVAGRTLLASINALNEMVVTATGLSITEPVTLATTAAAGGVALAAGGAALAVGIAAATQRPTSTVGFQDTGDSPRVGDVAADMGASPLTMADELTAAGQQRRTYTTSTGPGSYSGPYASDVVIDGEYTTVDVAGYLPPTALRQPEASDGRADVGSTSHATRVEAGKASEPSAANNQDSSAISMEGGQIVYATPRPAEQLPVEVVTAQVAQINLARAWTAGYTSQPQTDGQLVIYCQTDLPATQDERPAVDQAAARDAFCARLITQGILAGNSRTAPVSTAEQKEREP